MAQIEEMANEAAGTTCQVKTGASGFGFAGDSTTFTTDSEFISLGQITAGGQTFANASTGLTAASVRWKYANEFDQKLPATSSSVEAHGASFDLLHAIVVDEDGDYHYDGADGGAFDIHHDSELVSSFNSIEISLPINFTKSPIASK